MSFISTVRISISRTTNQIGNGGQKKDPNIGNIGVRGFRHYDFIKQNRPSAASATHLNGTLESFKEVDQEATEMLDTLVRTYGGRRHRGTKTNGSTRMGAKMNNIRSRAEGGVLNEIIYR